MKIYRLICGGIASVMMMVSAASLSAQDIKWCMVSDTGAQVAMDRVSFLLASDVAESFYIVLNDGSMIEGVSKVTFQKLDISAITPVVGGHPEVVIYGGKITVMGCAQGADLQVYTIDGKMISKTKNDGMDTSIDVSTLSIGVYILRVGDKSVKFRKR